MREKRDTRCSRSSSGRCTVSRCVEVSMVGIFGRFDILGLNCLPRYFSDVQIVSVTKVS